MFISPFLPLDSLMLCQRFSLPTIPNLTERAVVFRPFPFFQFFSDSKTFLQSCP